MCACLENCAIASSIRGLRSSAAGNAKSAALIGRSNASS
eukprot:COSAG04_NODE_26166_length_298_cov_1.035176_2_plen_38_part_01